MRKFFILCALCATTLTGSAAYQGALGGKFTINAQGNQVFFSKGNLQYRANPSTWQFATNQYDTIGGANKNISATYTGWIDLFGWGTGNNPTAASSNDSDYPTYTEWGNNAISNGGDEANIWRTLTSNEWVYLIRERTNATTLFGFATVNGVHGLILLPDNWALPNGASFTASSTTQGWGDKGTYYSNPSYYNYDHNTYSAEQWAVMETAGAVFLPAAGRYYINKMYELGNEGYYWSATPSGTSDANYICFAGHSFYPQEEGGRAYRRSVRLVQDYAPVSVPVISYTESVITDVQQIELSCSTAGAEIYYTLDGTTPGTSNGTRYTTPITITVNSESDESTITLQAIAFSEGEKSPVVTHTYNLTLSEYNITSGSVRNGSVSVPLTAKWGKTVTITAVPYTGYYTYKYVVDGVEQEEDTFVMPKKDVTVSAIFALEPLSFNNGALNGSFSINEDGDHVRFSQGNLQYRANPSTWQFATNQYDTIGTANKNISDSYDGWIDLFGWGTGDAPTKKSTDYEDYATFTDWGTNAISNGGDEANLWHTLTQDEWVYLFYGRTNAATLFGFGSVNGINGLILLPDNWVLPDGASFVASTTQGLTDQGGFYQNTNGNNFKDNTYTNIQWAEMEAAGAVFLPAAGVRYSGTEASGAGSNAYYWSATPERAPYAYRLMFYSGTLNPQSDNERAYGHSVRLVQGYEPVPEPVISYTENVITDAQLIELSCPAAGADIYYTLDGTKPSAINGTLYTAPISIAVDLASDGTTVTLNVIAIDNGEKSPVVTRSYTLALSEYTITADSVLNGFVSALPKAKCGMSITITAMPNEGYNTYSYVVDGVEQEESTFVMPAKNVTIGAIFIPEPSTLTKGALNGTFAVNAHGDKIHFSKGNLQYQPSSGTLQFAAKQYERIGPDNSNISDTYTGWIDLFGWGTGDNPANTSTEKTDYATFADWGTNAISNGGNEPDAWRTLTKDEWVYLFFGRTNVAKLFGLGTVDGVPGTILLPDDWVLPDGVDFTPSTEKGLNVQGDFYYNSIDKNNYSHNIYTAGQWSVMEAMGAVFFPAAGNRNGTEMEEEGRGFYWSATLKEANRPYYFGFLERQLIPQNDWTGCYGFSVRLVQDVPNVPTAIDQTGSSSLQGGDRGRLILVNGMLLIERNGNIFNTLGIRIK